MDQQELKLFSVVVFHLAYIAEPHLFTNQFFQRPVPPERGRIQHTSGDLMYGICLANKTCLRVYFKGFQTGFIFLQLHICFVAEHTTLESFAGDQRERPNDTRGLTEPVRVPAGPSAARRSPSRSPPLFHTQLSSSLLPSSPLIPHISA